MRLHILSDLHNEIQPFFPAVLDADVTILAGDIHTQGRGVEWALQAFPGRVLYVPGNHEFWKGNIDATLAKMKAIAENSGGRIQVLQRDAVVIDGVRFLGATGWTDFALDDEYNGALNAARGDMREFSRRLIRHGVGYKVWRVEDAQQESLRTRQWLGEELAMRFDGPTVVVTHHAPSMRSLKTSSPDGLDLAYANAWDDLMGPAVLWVHGHIHQAVDYLIGGTRVISNPGGYPGQATGFDPGLIVTV